MSRLNQQIPSQNKNSLERKFQKTMENLKTSDRLLPRSYLDKNSNLIPNHLATKTFKQGRTLHSVLCGEETSQKVLSSTSGKKDRIPFYRDVNRSMNSTISSISSSGTQMTSQTGPRRRIEFSKAIGSPTSNPRFDENGYAIPSTTNSPPKIKITKDIGSPQVFCEGHTTLLIDDENFESAFEESFDTEERERREKINKKNNNSEDKSMDHLDKLNNTNINGDAGSPINLPNIQNEGHIFMADLDKHVREIKEGLNFVSEKLDSVVDHMDKTLGEDPNISDDNLMANNKFGYLYTSFKSTQTPVSWLNKGDNVVEKQNKVQHKASQDEKRKRDLMLDRKYLLRHRIDTLKEFTRIQLYLIREEQRNAVDDKDCFSNKFKQLMSDFDAEKKKIKMELLNCFDKSTLINHYIQMFKQQEETRKLIACFKAKQELKLMECHQFDHCLGMIDKYSSRNINQINESLNSTLEDVSEGLISSFKPSEKSLRSILSSLPNSSTGRDSLSRRRSSASEALLKLRIMNNVPTISTKSPPCQKSPPRTTPRSPTERYLTKFPQNISSRESISNDEALILRQSLGPVELLEDLPNASQLGMVLDLSHSPSVSLPDVNILIKKEDEYSEEKKFIENYVKLHWNEFIENGEIVNDLFSIEEILKNNLNDQLKIPNNLLQQLCYEHWFNLIWNSNCLLSSKHILLSKENLIGYLQKEILSPFIDKLKKEICPNGIKTRAEKTSHLALDVNRLLLAQYVYENLTI